MGDPSAASVDLESGGELFVRFQLTQGINLMPDVQYWSNSLGGGSSSGVWIFGFRLNFEY